MNAVVAITEYIQISPANRSKNHLRNMCFRCISHIIRRRDECLRDGLKKCKRCLSRQYVEFLKALIVKDGGDVWVSIRVYGSAKGVYGNSLSCKYINYYSKSLISNLQVFITCPKAPKTSSLTNKSPSQGTVGEEKRREKKGRRRHHHHQITSLGVSKTKRSWRKSLSR